jgi:hypothetical protein
VRSARDSAALFSPKTAAVRLSARPWRMQCREPEGLPGSAASDKSDLAGSAPENLTAVNIGPSRRNTLSYVRINMNI